MPISIVVVVIISFFFQSIFFGKESIIGSLAPFFKSNVILESSIYLWDVNGSNGCSRYFGSVFKLYSNCDNHFSSQLFNEKT